MRVATTPVISHGLSVWWGTIVVFVIEPFDALTFIPDTLTLVALRSDEYAFSMLLSMGPLAFIGTAVGVCVDAVAMLLIVYIFALVLPSVGPHIHTLTVHVVFQPVSLVCASIVPDILTVS